jgi:Rrf2 family transcriptional regulator, iron-sulfur cluster assembly transcription factor
MIFSSAAEYAIRGVAELAARGGSSRVLLDDLVAGTGLPRDFMAKVFQKLVHGRVLASAKGRGGGFSLARPAHEITLVQIVEAVEGPQAYDRCVVGLERCNDQMPCAQHDLYKPIRQRIKDYLNTTTAADLAASLRSKQAWQRARVEASAAQGIPPPQAAADSAVD